MSIDFRKLKFNLYELLNVNQSESFEKINHNYRHIIKKFHPDKGKLSELEEDIRTIKAENRSCFTSL